MFVHRFHKFLLFLGYPPNLAVEVKVNVFCKVLSEFALEFRTAREKALQQKEKKANQRERKKTRGKTILEVRKASVNRSTPPSELLFMAEGVFFQTEKFAKKPHIEKQREDDLQKVLHNGYNTEEEKSSSLMLPGAKVRKRYSLGQCFISIV